MRLSRLIVLGSLTLVTGMAMAQPVLSAAMTCDNVFTAYISQDPNTQGTAFLSGANWQATINGSVNLDAGGGTYYLHIVGVDQGGPRMMIGEFHLSGDATFANGTQTLLTNTTDWLSNSAGFGSAMATPIDFGNNAGGGAAGWGTRPGISNDARFIWDASNASEVYFSAVINVVPAPGAGLAILGGLAVAARRRR